MELFIRITDGQPVDHPILATNLLEVYPGIDLNNPVGFAKFVRVQAPVLGPYEKNLTVSYQLVDGAYTDVFSKELMTQEEILEKQQHVKTSWAQNNGFASWTFNEETCQFEAPVAIPDGTNRYMWRESDLSWVYMPAPPAGDGWYFNVETGLWNNQSETWVNPV